MSKIDFYKEHGMLKLLLLRARKMFEMSKKTEVPFRRFRWESNYDLTDELFFHWHIKLACTLSHKTS